jgi:hypothetical protein
VYYGVMARSVALLALALVWLVPAGRSDPGIDWDALHRPLQLPTLQPGQACPISPRSTEVTGGRYGVDGAIGAGPVYPILGPSRSLLAFFRPDEWGRGPWAGQKVLWLVRPDYEGPVLIRGRRLGGWQWMRFDRGARPGAEIRLEPGETVTWTGQQPGSRGRPSYVRVRAAGCYAVQIDGTSFTEVVVFPVDVGR